MDWKVYAWLKRGRRRKSALRLIANSKNPLTVNETKAKLKIAMAQASLTIKELSDKKLIKCVNPKDKIGRLYAITKTGREIVNGI